MKRAPGILLLALLAGAAPEALAASASALPEVAWQEQALRFFTFQDPSVRHAVLGTACLGIACGLMGSFIVVRRLALLGDTLSHAVLPGIALGFLWSGTKDPVALFIGAVAAGLLGTLLTQWIQQTTRLKEDASLGLVLGGFYGVGVVLLRIVQDSGSGQQSGIQSYLFGQAAALSRADVLMIAVVTGVILALVGVFFRQLQVTCFDLTYARALGLPAVFWHTLILLLLSFAVVVGLQAVGIVLVSALLITPAATAYLLTHRLQWMLLLAAAGGMLSGVSGAFISFLGPGLPTGPFIVLSASALFLCAFLAAPRQGLVARVARKRARRARIARENALKGLYQVLEAAPRDTLELRLGDYSRRRGVTPVQAISELQPLHRRGELHWLDPEPGAVSGLTQDTRLRLSPKGWSEACRVVRNHRLWELYLAQAARLESDHVHDDAEIIEHVLGEAVVRQLEEQLEHPALDPHGRPIPQPLAAVAMGNGPTPEAHR